jgi:hypothetical protein
MEITLSEFDIEKYTRRRMCELRGDEVVYGDSTMDPALEEYTRRRMKELNLEEQMRQRKINLDKTSRLGYTVATMTALVLDEE